RRCSPTTRCGRRTFSPATSEASPGSSLPWPEGSSRRPRESGARAPSRARSSDLPLPGEGGAERQLRGGPVSPEHVRRLVPSVPPVRPSGGFAVGSPAMRDTRMSLASFERLAARGNLVPVWRELPGDTETPVSAFLKLPTPSHAFLLESVQGGERWGRYSFLGDEPIALVRQGPDGTILEQSGSRTFEDQLPPLEALRELMDAFEFVRPDDAPPFVGGLVGYLGHGAVRWFEPRVPQRHGPDPDFPDGEWMLVDRCAVFDNLSHRLRIWASVHLPLYATVEEAYRAAMRRADALAESFQRPLPPPAPAPELGGLDDGWDRAGFEAAVTRAREYIAAGDCYQVVLSRRLSADYRGDPFELYRSLRRVSPTPYLFFLRFGD